MSKPSPFDYIKIINGKTGYPDTLTGYENFIVNRNYSQGPETIYYANMINVNCDKQLNFDFYYYALPRSRKFNAWAKRDKEKASTKETLNKIIEYYNCSMSKAQDIYKVLEATNQISEFTARTDKGGI